MADIDDLRSEIEAGIAEVLGQSQAVSVVSPDEPSPDMADVAGEPGPFDEPPFPAPLSDPTPEGEQGTIDVPWADLAIAGPQPIKAQLHCPHGFPSPSSCWECMLDGPVAPIPPSPAQQLKATRFQVARYATRCERPTCSAEIEPGEPIGYVEGLGWCCKGCCIIQ